MYKAVVFDFVNVLCGASIGWPSPGAAPSSKLSARDLDAALWASARTEHETALRFPGFYVGSRPSRLEPPIPTRSSLGDYRRIILPNRREAGLITAKIVGALFCSLQHLLFARPHDLRERGCFHS
jgi:hypothetical protein